jgi:hypothetical protein|tara:strand:- start:439 stop:750 length:312 start_codon:yes stop_codon:yes gene_type:complete
VKVKKPLLVEVEWRDIFATCGWEKLEEVIPPTFYTYGYLIYKDKDTIKVACTKDESGDWFATHAFPRGCVKKIRPLSGATSISSQKQVGNKTRNENIASIPEN